MPLKFRELVTSVDQETQTTTKPTCSCQYPSTYPLLAEGLGRSGAEASAVSAANLSALLSQLRQAVAQA